MRLPSAVMPARLPKGEQPRIEAWRLHPRRRTPEEITLSAHRRIIATWAGPYISQHVDYSGAQSRPALDDLRPELPRKDSQARAQSQLVGRSKALPRPRPPRYLLRRSSSWEDALAWLASQAERSVIDEIQYWGHGKWGCARIEGESLDEHSLKSGTRPSRPLRYDPRVASLRFSVVVSQLRDLWRRCRPSLRSIVEQFFWLSHRRTHLHYRTSTKWSSSPATGEEPHWPREEGLAEGSPEAPIRAKWSHLSAPNTISCFHGSVPLPF